MLLEAREINYASSDINFVGIPYLRVSDKSQVLNGSGLDSQDTRCRAHSDYLGIPVGEVFIEEGVSGALLERPAMKRLLHHIKTPPPNVRYVVIVDDISRLC